MEEGSDTELEALFDQVRRKVKEEETRGSRAIAAFAPPTPQQRTLGE